MINPAVLSRADAPDIAPLDAWQLPSGSVLACVGCPSIRQHHAVLLGQRLVPLAQEARGRMGLGLAAVEECSSTFLNVLMHVSRVCRDLSGQLVLFDLSRELARAVRMTDLRKDVRVVRNELAAERIFDR